MSRHNITIATLTAGILLGGALATGLSVYADGNPATDTVPRILPYQGVLELDGRPVHATGAEALAIEFALYDGADAATPVYTQATSVEVYSGRFTTSMGPTGVPPEGDPVALADVIQAADDLHLGLTLLGEEGPDDDVSLANRQRIASTAYAMWTTSATDLSVARDLFVARNAHVRGELTVDAAVSAATVSATTVSGDTVTGDAVTGGTVTAETVTGDTVTANTNMTTNSLGAQSVNTTTLTTTQDATVGNNLIVNGSYLRLPRRATAPGQCNEDRVGWVYFDTNSSNVSQRPCVCVSLRLITQTIYTWTSLAGDGSCD